MNHKAQGAEPFLLTQKILLRNDSFATPRKAELCSVGKNAQGAIEYLLIIGAAILVVAIVILAVTGGIGMGKTTVTGAQGDVNNALKQLGGGFENNSITLEIQTDSFAVATLNEGSENLVAIIESANAIDASKIKLNFTFKSLDLEMSDFCTGVYRPVPGCGEVTNKTEIGSGGTKYSYSCAMEAGTDETNESDGSVKLMSFKNCADAGVEIRAQAVNTDSGAVLATATKEITANYD